MAAPAKIREGSSQQRRPRARCAWCGKSVPIPLRPHNCRHGKLCSRCLQCVGRKQEAL